METSKTKVVMARRIFRGVATGRPQTAIREKEALNPALLLRIEALRF
jgi:hypothetical protein